MSTESPETNFELGVIFNDFCDIVTFFARFVKNAELELILFTCAVNFKVLNSKSRRSADMIRSPPEFRSATYHLRCIEASPMWGHVLSASPVMPHQTQTRRLLEIFTSHMKC